MTTHLRRTVPLSAAAVSGVVVVALLAAVIPAQASTGTMAFDCAAPGIGSQPLNFILDTNAPAKMYVGRSFKPTLSVKVTIPKFVIQLAQSPFVGVTQADATGVVTVGINGRPVKGTATFPRTQLPNPAVDFPVNLPVALPVLKPTAAGTITYTPGPLTANLKGYKSNGDYVGGVNANCTVKTAKKVIDKVVVVKSATKTTGRLVSIPGKKVRASATVAATSGVLPVGAVTAKVYRGKKLLATRKGTLANGAVSAVFPKPAKKGRYKVVISYAGSKAHLASSTAKTFRIR